MLREHLLRQTARFWQAFNAETRIASRSLTIHWLGWIWPLLLFTVISGVYHEGTLQNMPVAVVDHDNSPLSHRLIRELDAASHARIIVNDQGLQQGLDDLRKAKVYGLLYLPADFEADTLARRTPKAEFYYNALLYSAGYAAIQDFPGLVASLNQELRPILAAGTGQTLPQLASITVSFDSLFNASGNFVYYQQFSALVHLLQLFVIVAMVHVLAREAPELKAFYPHILRERALGIRLLGKLAPYTLLFTALLTLQIFLLVTLSGARINGNPWWMLATVISYVIAAQSIGLILFILTRNRYTAYTLIGMLIGIAQTYSGILIPELAMPKLAQFIAEAEPLTHALHGLFDQFLRDAPPSSALYTCFKLSLYPLFAYLLARLRLRKRLNLGPS